MSKKIDQNIINHVVLVLDASGSMWQQHATVIKVADKLVAHMAQRSKDMNQETRITIYSFGNEAECLVYDMDALRVPSLNGYYEIDGMTALVDATQLAVDDLLLTSQKYGDHAFIMFVLTDGEENASKHQTRAGLARTLKALPANWTIAAMVPNTMGKIKAQDSGFPAQNIEIWDATTARGVEESGLRVAAAVDSYMVARSTGATSVQNVFDTSLNTVNSSAIAQANLTPLKKGEYTLIHVPEESVIKEFVEQMGHKYVVGKAFYELVKRERIQLNKDLVIVNKKTKEVYAGAGARKLLNLPDMEVRITPTANKEWSIYVQSTSVNRKLPEHSNLIVLA